MFTINLHATVIMAHAIKYIWSEEQKKAEGNKEEEEQGNNYKSSKFCVDNDILEFHLDSFILACTFSFVSLTF